MMAANFTIWPTVEAKSGRESDCDWDRFFTELTEPIDFLGIREHSGWSPALFTVSGRKADHVACVTALVLDVDGGWSLPAAQLALDNLFGFIHTTKKHTDDVHRFRIVLPLDRAVTPEEHAHIWRVFEQRYSGKFDPACKDASRFWFLPGVVDDGPYRAIRLSGERLSADDLLEVPIAVAAPDASQLRNDNPDAIERRAIAYIAKMDAAIAGQHGHDACFLVALVLARGFDLGESGALRLLSSEYNHRCQPRWSDKELAHKARTADRNGKVPRGFILSRDPDAMASLGLPQEPTPVESPETPVASDEADEDAVSRFQVRTMRQVLKGVYDRCYAREPVSFVSSGVDEIDRIIGGYRPEMITVVGAQTNWGKSSWAILALDDGIRAGKKVLLVSGEDSESTFGKRIMARRAGVSALDLRDERVSASSSPGENSDLSRMATMVTAAEDVPWFFDGRGKSAEYCAEAVRQLIAQESYELVIIDYLQAFRSSKRSQDRRNEVTNVARAFCDVIKTCGAAGMLLSQLKRLDSDTREPSKHDLKESGDIENMAEHVLLGWTSKSGARLIKVDKNKDGPQLPQGVELRWDERTASFIRTAKWQSEEWS